MTPAGNPHRSPTSPRITIRCLSKYFGRFTALDCVDLTIEPGEFVVVLGRNGAGKTTLLRIVGLLQQPSEGELLYAGQPAETLPVTFRQRIGFVGHESFLYDDLTVQENLLFYARLYGLSDGASRIEEVLSVMGLEARAQSLVRHLSRGLKQRLALARAWLHRPDILLLDEPATGLDIPTREHMHTWLASCHKEGRTVVLISHELRETLQPATRIVLLEQGRVAFDGPNGADSQEQVQARLAAR